MSDPEACGCLAVAAVEGPDLLRRFAGVSDGRSDQGRDHPVAVVLTLCAAAVLAGMGSFTAIAGWVADVPAELLARLYVTPAPRAPSKTTLWRVVTSVDAPAVDVVIGAWLAEQAQRATASADPPDPTQLVRQHWDVEALHWLRDTVYREDHSRTRTGSGPQVMAGLRNLAIGALHLA